MRNYTTKKRKGEFRKQTKKKPDSKRNNYARLHPFIMNRVVKTFKNVKQQQQASSMSSLDPSAQTVETFETKTAMHLFVFISHVATGRLLLSESEFEAPSCVAMARRSELALNRVRFSSEEAERKDSS